MKNWLLTPPNLDDFLRLLRAWRFWLVGALIGGMLGAGWYNLFPPQYRARATVVIDFNAEQAWPVNSDKELFYYLTREALKLKELAWADTTLQKVANESGFSIPELRTAKLELSQPEDGGWHFYATDTKAAVAAQLAATWATTFTEQTRLGIQAAIALDLARQALEANPTDPNLQSAVARLETQTLGITPEMNITPAQVENIPVSRKTGQGTYVLAGAGIFLALSALLVLLKPR